MENRNWLKKVILLGVATIITTAVLSNVWGQEKEKNLCKVDIERLFYPTGWMGDGEYGKKYVQLDGACRKDPNTPPTCIQISYTFGPLGWAGIYWQNKPDNWGDKPGNDYSKEELKCIKFWAKGYTGEEVIEFKAGGIKSDDKPYRDSFEQSLGRLTLSKEWKKYTIDMERADLSSVIGGFCWVASRDYNSGRKTIIFYLDNICFE